MTNTNSNGTATTNPLDDRPDGIVVSSHQLQSIVSQLTHVPDERDCRVEYADISSAVVSIVLRFVGIAINARLAYDFYVSATDGGEPSAERYGYFVWTVVCLTVPMLVTACVQLALYSQDVSEHRTVPKSHPLCSVILLPLFVRYWHWIRYAIACKRAEERGDRAAQMRYYELLIHLESDLALIRIFECFLEVAPQKILQIYIILRSQQRPTVEASDAIQVASMTTSNLLPPDVTVLQLLSVGSALVSMAWCIAAYHRAIRWSQVDKLKLSWCGSLCQWLCHLLITVSRVLAIALVASVCARWTLVACAAHALLMAGWCLVLDRSPFCSQSCAHSNAFALVLGAVFVFTFVLPRPRRRTCGRFGAFYALCGAENAAAVVVFVWQWQRQQVEGSAWSGGWLSSVWVVGALCALAIVPFVLGVGLMVVYYVVFHPNVVARRQERLMREKREQAVGQCVARSEMSRQGMTTIGA